MSISDKMIVDRLLQIDSLDICWVGRMPSDSETWRQAAMERLPDVGVAEVRAAMERIVDMTDSDQEALDGAISLACQPVGLPDGACVGLIFA